MKNRFIYVLLLGLLATGCSKSFLDTEPLDKYSNGSLWTSKNDANAALTSCYSKWENGINIVYDDCISDNGIDQFPWEGYEVFASGSATPSNPGVDKYDYLTIQRCNWFLENVDKVPVSSLDEELKNRMKAEARFLRAYRYWLMSQVYGDIPFVTKNMTPDESKTVGKTAKAEITAFVLKELTEIAAVLPASYSGSDIGRITSGAALALKARIQLYNAQYKDCIATCQQLMKAPYTYDIYQGGFEALFRPQNANNTEVILDVQYLVNDNAQDALGAMLPNSFGGWSSMAPTQSLVDAFETRNGLTIDKDPTYNALQPYNNRDPRLDATVIRPGQLYMGKYFASLNNGSLDLVGNNNASPTGFNFKKYVANIDDYDGTAYGTDIWNTGGSMILIRYAEVLLTYAEAKIEDGQIDASVYDAINKIRRRATVGMPVVTAVQYAGQDALRNLVRRERRVELAGEGLRWYDIQRWKIGAQALNGQVLGSLKGTVNTTNGALTLTPNSNYVAGTRSFEDKFYRWPIPQKEIDINKNLLPNNGY